jgi:hypothetical protein
MWNDAPLMAWRVNGALKLEWANPEYLTALEAKSLEQAMAAGGCGFIPKPVIASEILLTALTFVIRARIAKASVARNALNLALRAFARR